jgi:hypothetical protein
VDVIKSFLLERKLIVGEGKIVDMTCGVLQGVGPETYVVERQV